MSISYEDYAGYTLGEARERWAEKYGCDRQLIRDLADKLADHDLPEFGPGERFSLSYVVTEWICRQDASKVASWLADAGLCPDFDHWQDPEMDHRPIIHGGKP